MQAFRFPVMGFDRSHWDFYRGFALTDSVLMAVMAVIAWQLAAVARRSPRACIASRTMRIMLTTTARRAADGGDAAGRLRGLLVLCVEFFLAVPIVFSPVAVGVGGWVVVLLRREVQAG